MAGVRVMIELSVDDDCASDDDPTGLTEEAFLDLTGSLVQFGEVGAITRVS